MDFELKIDENGRVYLPEEIRKLLDGKEIVAVANRRTVLLMPKNVHPEVVMDSIDVIKKDLEVKQKEESLRSSDEKEERR